MKLTAKSIVISLNAALLFAAPMASAQDDIREFSEATVQKTASTSKYSLDKFVPRPSPDKAKTRIDFSTLDTILRTGVLYTGPSTRIHAPRKRSNLGSRIKTSVGHTSPYQNEGNKVLFSTFNKAHKAELSDYQDELERLGNEIDISTLPRNQQLAYWFNLHNVTVMDIVAQKYPVRRPSSIRIRPGKTRLHDAKLITLQGVPLSLRDIREKIVFSNWKDPNVIYGFWHGDIGSPSLQNYAFTGRNLSKTLDFIADEFSNSLRGVNRRKNVLSVSKLYYDTAPYYFPNFETDLKAHLSPHLRDNVKPLFANYSAIKPDGYETDIADTTGGVGNRLLSGSASVNRGMGFLPNICPGCTAGGLAQSFKSNTTRGNYIDAIAKKRGVLEVKGEGRITSGTVSIIDIETLDRSPEIK